MSDSVEAMQKYVDNSDKYVLKVSTKNNVEYLEAKNKGVMTFIAKFLGFKSYKLETVCGFVKNNQSSLENNPIFSTFYARLAKKVSNHNQNHSSHKITNLFKTKTGVKSTAPDASALRQKLEEVLTGTGQIAGTNVFGMGAHMRKEQAAKVLEFYDAAQKTPNPKQTFIDSVNANLQIPGSWKADAWEPEKAGHIINNFNEIYSKTSPPFKASNAGQKTPQAIEIANIAQRDKVVAFYKSGPTEFLGNFAICPNGLQVFGENFRCAEAAFQWRKYSLAGLPPAELKGFFKANGEQAFDLRNKLEAKYPHILGIGTPFAVAWSSSGNADPDAGIQQGSGGNRDEVMWQILQKKFSQNPKFMTMLDATKGAYLLEHNNRAGKDKYWSDNNDGTGLNTLGKYLTAIRDGLPRPTSGGIDPAMQAHVNHANNKLAYKIF